MPNNSRLFSVILFFVASTVLAEEWHSLSDQQTLSISGIAPVDSDRFLVVHDNKKSDQPRLSIVNWQNKQNPTLSPIKWCDQSLPIDLEAITVIPGHKNDYLVLESKGKVTRIQLDPDKIACKTIARFEIPTATPESNMEGLALHCIKKHCLLAWAERGDDKTPAKLSWSGFNIEKNSLKKSSSAFNFKAPYPETDLRSISDIAMDSEGAVWVSAASDPGDDGFFKSALYKIGSFTKKGKWLPSQKITSAATYESEDIKIEALVFTPSGLIMATDDENKGAKIAIK
ncbi:MAG: hypothetical protein WCP96_16870 [Methylococcaceae bacterium]